MKIVKVTLETTCLEKMKTFYHEVMELPLLEDFEEYFTVGAGSTVLTFIHSDQKPYYHAAFRTDLEHFHYMYRKLEKLGVLLENEQGETSMFWKGKQLYFHDPEGNILEILERPNPAQNPLKGFFDIGEIGLPAPDLSEMSQFLSPLPNEFPSLDPVFRFFGGIDGVFVLVKAGRPWYPTQKSAYISPVTVEVTSEDAPEQELNHPTLPYQIKVKA
ncbi:VOC family protein [Bacillus tianshenii]|uniref:VOC family protein n=1 Tax=Sutcliffiella tianshenii TaxID=1463404 RepID=UPI001CD78729|nr:VOC family protein [Bacillus tianshenii]MCA1322113.1 VOC family protein [Bacillus tianshenii]